MDLRTVRSIRVFRAEVSSEEGVASGTAMCPRKEERPREPKCS